MKATLLCGILGMGLVACASPERIRAGAYAHEMKAQRLEARGDFENAAREREAAARQHRKAAMRESYFDPTTF
jgi:hypothetical protein